MGYKRRYTSWVANISAGQVVFPPTVDFPHVVPSSPAHILNE